MFQAKILMVENKFSITQDVQLRLQKIGYYISCITKNYVQVPLYIKESIPDMILADIQLSNKNSRVESVKGVYA